MVVPYAKGDLVFMGQHSRGEVIINTDMFHGGTGKKCKVDGKNKLQNINTWVKLCHVTSQLCLFAICSVR